ncbi:MAG: hypothetical protein PHF84_00090 [bacterium]|nr:hypothetical protein [bacterium]
MKKIIILSFCLFLTLFTYNLSAQSIDTIAGNGFMGYTGDGIKALDASLYNPMSICLDDLGNIYIADMQNNRIRMIDNLQVIHTMGGTGNFGFNGDEQRAVKCNLAFPMGVHVQTVDKEKKKVRIFICDSRNNKIRMVNEFGIMRTMAGSGRFGNSGDNGPAVKADFAWPTSITLDENGNIYIADTYNNKIRVIYFKGSIAGDNSKKIIPDPRPGYIYNLVGTGMGGYGGDGELANIANLRTPWDVIPVNGELYISDKDNHIIRKVSREGIISTIAGIPGINGYYGDILKATEEKLNLPYGLWADANAVYIADSMNSRIRKIVDKDNSISTICGIGEFGFSGDGAPANICMISHPVDIFGDGKGNFYICDLENQRIRLITGGQAQQKTGTGAEK